MVLCVADKEVNPLNDKRLTNGSLALNNKKVITIDAVKTLEEAKLRVAAYARVSSDSTDQLNSFVAQTTHYISLISSNENWTLVDIYADEGISGTLAEKRPRFKKMIEERKEKGWEFVFLAANIDAAETARTQMKYEAK